MMDDIWQYWRDALAGNHPAIDANSPQCGFYRLRRDGEWRPVMIRFGDDGKTLRCRVGDDSSADPYEIWTWCADKPIEKAVAKIAFETGSFPGDVEGAPTNEGSLSLAEQIKDYAAQAVAWLRKNGVKSKTDGDKAANYRAELLRLRKEADTQRDAEKRPHLEAGRAIDAKFKPLIEDADKAANELRDALTVYMREEEKRQEAERRAKWEAERRAAEAARAEVEAQQAKLMRDDPIAALTSQPVELPELPPPPEATKVQAGGQRGRKTGLREITSYVVTDHAAALAFFAESEAVRELVQKLASQACKAGVKVPGVEVRTEKVAA